MSERAISESDPYADIAVRILRIAMSELVRQACATDHELKSKSHSDVR